MATEQPMAPSEEYGQLEQVKVPLEQAADAFMKRDSSGRMPIVVVPERPNRIRNNLVMAGVLMLAASWLAGVLVIPFWTVIPGTGIGIALLVLGVFRSFMVPVPEGTSGLLARGGRFSRTIGAGTHIVPPWIAVSHLVTRRQIPFDVQVIDAPTSDTVRVTVDALLTFTIEDPYAFVFSIAADDFDEVLQATSQEAIRALVRRVTVDEVFNFVRSDTQDVLEMIMPDVAPYGVQISRVRITFVSPPVPFLLTEEQRQLAVRQLDEQASRHTLAERLQTDADALERQRLLAHAERVNDELQLQQVQAEAQRGLFELEAASEALRLERLEERLRQFPLAAQYDVESQRLDIARALAGNTRALLQIGSADDISRLMLVRHSLIDGDVASAAPESVNDNGNPLIEISDPSAAPQSSDTIARTVQPE